MFLGAQLQKVRESLSWMVYVYFEYSVIITALANCGVNYHFWQLVLGGNNNIIQKPFCLKASLYIRMQVSEWQ